MAEKWKVIRGDEIYGVDTDKPIAFCSTPAKAQRIVLEHNSHKALVEACKKGKWLYDQLSLSPIGAVAQYGPDYEPPGDEDLLAIRQLFEAALALAEVKL